MSLIPRLQIMHYLKYSSAGDIFFASFVILVLFVLLTSVTNVDIRLDKVVPSKVLLDSLPLPLATLGLPS